MERNKAIKPVPEHSRIDLLDIYRGFAIFGILVVNIEIMNCLIINQGSFGQQWNSEIDNLSYRILQLFFYSKFFPMFSFLFGLGVGMQLIKLSSNKAVPIAFLIRRMIVLFAFGVLHISFLWSGDILHLYAIIGIIAIPFLRVNEKYILAISIVLFVFPFYEEVFGFIFKTVGFDFHYLINQYSSEDIIDIIRRGTFAEQIKLRWADYFSNTPLLVGMLAPIATSMFFLGLYFAKKKYFYELKELIFKIRKPTLGIFTLITAYRLFFIFILTDLEIYNNPTFKPIFLHLIFLSDVLTGLFYLWLIGWVYQFGNLKKLLRPLKFVGKMALSNYILQSVIGLFIFYSIGLSLYETLSPAMTVMIAVLIFTFQIVLSMVWFEYFKFGPLEWLWRVLSYGKIIPIMKDSKKLKPTA